MSDEVSRYVIPPKSHGGGSDPVIDSALRAACSISLLWSSFTEVISVFVPDVVVAGAEKRADDEFLEEDEESPSGGIKQVECSDLRNGVEQKLAVPLHVQVCWMKLFPADEREMTLKPRANPMFRVEAMIAIDTAPRDGFMVWWYDLPTYRTYSVSFGNTATEVVMFGTHTYITYSFSAKGRKKLQVLQAFRCL